MEFLVIAQLTAHPGGEPEPDPQGQPVGSDWRPWAARRMRYRNSYEAQELRHVRMELLADHRVPNEETRLRSVAIVTVNTVPLLTFRLSTPPDPDLTTPAAEEACNSAVEYLLDQVLERRAQTRWVNRSLLVDNPSEAPAGWLPDHAVDVELAPDSRGGAPAVSSLGWGNNLLVGYDDLTEVEQREVHKGLIDSQVIWVSLESIAHRSATVARSQADTTERTRREVRAHMREAEDLLTEISTHNLLYDDMALNIQGHRRMVALSTLSSWRYDETSARIDARVRNIEQIAARQRDRLDAAYQGAVENVLVFLGIVSGMQLLLAVVDLAFAGDVTERAGGDREGLMHVLRTVNTDLWLLLAVVLVAGLFVYLNLLRRKR